jgi:phospholipase/carboxylesterase
MPLSIIKKIGDSATVLDFAGCSGKARITVLMSLALGCSVLAFIMYTNSVEIEFIERQTGIDPEFSIIWLHGLGADGHDFEPIVPQFGLPENLPVRFIFPHAPVRPITVNNGMEMRGWYDIIDLPVDAGQPRQEDREGLAQSAQIVYSLIDQENQRGIPTSRIFLAGFSQGGVIALFAGLRLNSRLAGIIALSAYLAEAETTKAEKSIENQSTPIFMGHGTQDPLIPVSIGYSSHDILTGLGYDVEWHTYEMPHSVHPREIDDISNFLKRKLAL